jgi:hypothetical protein
MQALLGFIPKGAGLSTPDPDQLRNLGDGLALLEQRYGVVCLGPLLTAPAFFAQQFQFAYSATLSPLPPNSAGKSFNFGSPSFMGRTVSA